MCHGQLGVRYARQGRKGCSQVRTAIWDHKVRLHSALHHHKLQLPCWTICQICHRLPSPRLAKRALASALGAHIEHARAPQHEMLVLGLPWHGRSPGARYGFHLAGICSKPRCDSTVSNGAVQLALPLYSFDVEYAHYRQGSTQLRVPAEIAVVAANLQVVMATYCAPGEHAWALHSYIS